MRRDFRRPDAVPKHRIFPAANADHYTVLIVIGSRIGEGAFAIDRIDRNIVWIGIVQPKLDGIDLAIVQDSEPTGLSGIESSCPVRIGNSTVRVKNIRPEVGDDPDGI